MGVSSEPSAAVGVAERNGEQAEAKCEQDDVEHRSLLSNAAGARLK